MAWIMASDACASPGPFWNLFQSDSWPCARAGHGVGGANRVGRGLPVGILADQHIARPSEGSAFTPALDYAPDHPGAVIHAEMVNVPATCGAPWQLLMFGPSPAGKSEARPVANAGR